MTANIHTPMISQVLRRTPKGDGSSATTPGVGRVSTSGSVLASSWSTGPATPATLAARSEWELGAASDMASGAQPSGQSCSSRGGQVSSSPPAPTQELPAELATTMKKTTAATSSRPAISQTVRLNLMGAGGFASAFDRSPDWDSDSNPPASSPVRPSILASSASSPGRAIGVSIDLSFWASAGPTGLFGTPCG